MKWGRIFHWRNWGWRNELELQAIGLQRSGNHAILAWLFQQCEDEVYFFNNVKHYGDPITRFRPLDLPNTVIVRKGKSRGRRHRLEKIRKAHKKVLAYSYENLPITELATRVLVPDRRKHLGNSRDFRRVLIIRDFNNWFASCVRYHEKTRMTIPTNTHVERLICMWISYAREYLGHTEYLADPGLVRIFYNRWALEDGYRLDLLGKLGIAARSNDISYVPDAGGGSSFDATTFSGRSSEMRTNDRWSYLQNEKFGEVLACVDPHREEIEKYNILLE